MRVHSRNLLTYALNLGVIAAFAIFLGFALVRLGEIERDMRIDATENMLWVIYQSHAASLRLDNEAARIVLGAEEADAMLRYDVLKSRLNLMQEGPQMRFIERLGLAPGFAEALRAAEELEPLLGQVEPGAVEAARRVHEQLQPLNAWVGRAANAAMVKEWDALGQRLDQHRYAVWQVIASVIGILVAGGLLSARLMLALRQTRRAEGSLRREMDFSQRLIASSGEGILTLDPELNCISWSHAMERLFALASNDCVGRPLTSAAPFFADPRIEEALRRSVSGEDVYVHEQTVDRADGSGFHSVDLACFPLRSDGAVVGAIVFVRDMTERHRAQREIASHRDRLEQLVKERTGDLEHAQRQLVSAIDTAPDGFAAFGADGRMVLANRKLRDLLPLDKGKLEIGAASREILREAMRYATVPDSCPSSEADTELLRELNLPCGRWIQMTVKPIPGGGTVMRLADVTPYKETARKLERALERERGVSESYRDFASMVSHQFRTPLAVIDSSMQRLVRRGDQVTTGDIAERAGKVRGAIKRLARLVEGTLDAARLETGQIEIKAEPCALAGLVEAVCERQTEATPDRRISVIAETGDKLPALAHCDPALVEHVMTNLLSNAVKYSPADTPIEVWLKSDEQAVYCAVRDHGVGVPSDEVARLFQPFVRATTAAGTMGTGIGLNLARNLARLQGGDVTVETREGVGSTFTLRLPRAEAPVREGSAA